MAITITGDSFEFADDAGFHNSLYRGKNLGSSVTAEQWSQINSGTFRDLFIGDYWTINNVKWRIAAFDYHLNKGPNGYITTQHHIIIVPDSNLIIADGTTHCMDAANNTTGGYKGSGYYSGINRDSSHTANGSKADCVAKAQAAFGASHILTHKEMITNASSGGVASASSWEDCTVECMTETMVYGFGALGGGKRNVGSEVSQLPLFQHRPNLIPNRTHWWLRDVVSSESFALVNGTGYASSDSASHSSVGIRPCFAIYQAS